ncbi:OmpH family outer membrane protein [Cecembia rubra]|uniref:Periplasmic chaperone for outer membrane proteins Skp n=1 Tax=Cecembia rubra TaxID=1485585 RepID=A0A2P8EDH7_9BACT|nr:OmpH family outer membrane protein [Cecembia rubra]PSL07508.1 periplasmic chaperone for outer membrane proteins Skp [Cecembia rubra]
MKKLAKVLGFLGVTAITLASCNQQGQSSNSNSGSESAAEVSITDLKIAYVLTDSVISKFDFYKEKSEEITEKGRKFESDLNSRARGFEQEVANFEQTASSMTMNQARAKQEELVRKERNLMTYRDNLMQELSADESKLYADVYDKVQEYLTQYAEEKELELILSYTRGGAIWYSKKALDITEDVIAGLNKKYADDKKSAEKK